MACCDPHVTKEPHQNDDQISKSISHYETTNLSQQRVLFISKCLKDVENFVTFQFHKAFAEANGISISSLF